MNLQTDCVQALCEELRLPGVWENHMALSTNSAETEKSYADFLEAALNSERDSRRARSAATMIRMAGFPATKTLKDYDFKFAITVLKRSIEA